MKMETLLFTGYINIINCCRMTMPLTAVVLSQVTNITIARLSLEMYLYHNSTSKESTISGLSIVIGTSRLNNYRSYYWEANSVPLL